MKAFVAQTSCNQFAYSFCVFGVLTIGCARLQQVIPKHVASMDKCILIASLLKGDLLQPSMTSFYMYDLPTLTLWSQTSLASGLLQTNLVEALGDWTPLSNLLLLRMLLARAHSHCFKLKELKFIQSCSHIFTKLHWYTLQMCV